MRKAALFVSGLLLTALASAPAVAEVVRVKVTARVAYVYDPGTMLHGQIVVGSRLTGTYVYNSNTPNTSDDPENRGAYVPYANEARMRFVSGGLVFENNQPTQDITINIDPQEGEYGWGSFEMSSFDNKRLPSYAEVTEITVRFSGTGNMTQSVALPTGVPELTNYDPKEVIVSTNFGQTFIVRAVIESAEAVVPAAVVVSPAAGSFLPNQQFDAALTLPRNSNVVSVIAKANGTPLPIGYPGACTLVPPPTNADQPAVLCPNANSLLPQAGGAPIEWTVELSNGSMLTETSNWTLLH